MSDRLLIKADWRVYCVRTNYNLPYLSLLPNHVGILSRMEIFTYEHDPHSTKNIYENGVVEIVVEVVFRRPVIIYSRAPANFQISKVRQPFITGKNGSPSEYKIGQTDRTGGKATGVTSGPCFVNVRPPQ